jgi:hypothetical protein
MLRRLWFLVPLVLILLPFTVDYLIAQGRMDNIQMSPRLDVPSVLADGKSEVTITIRVTENGQPRVGDTLQAWIQTGGGLLLPTWAFTDESGEATFGFAPNPLTRYDVTMLAEISVRNISIARLVEVPKDILVPVPLEVPEEEEDNSGGSIFG